MLCRFPDLYDHGQLDGDFEESSGLGRYGLMSSVNHLNRGKTPSPICAYLRNLAGWRDNEIILNNPGAYTASHGDYSTVMRYMTDKPHDFLEENRLQQGLDRYLLDTGLAIYHCNTRGSNEHQDGTPDEHYQCALLQADGRYDLEKNTGNVDSGDLFSATDGIALSDTTHPHSREWDGSDPGRRIAEISHSYRGDLHIELISSSGQHALLRSRDGDTQPNLQAVYTDQTTAPLQIMVGETVEGEWTLHVRDLAM